MPWHISEFFPLFVIVGVIMETSKRAGNGFVKTSALAVGGQSLLAAAAAMSIALVGGQDKGVHSFRSLTALLVSCRNS